MRSNCPGTTDSDGNPPAEAPQTPGVVAMKLSVARNMTTAKALLATASRAANGRAAMSRPISLRPFVTRPTADRYRSTHQTRVGAPVLLPITALVDQVVHALREVPVLVDRDGGQAREGVEATEAERVQFSHGFLVHRIRSGCPAGGPILGEQCVSPRPASKPFRGQVVAQRVQPVLTE